jgi:aspartyl-tRNA(Asn)/glutamyl-tRNA(Gln) amidotransferase subunit A
VAYGSSLDQIGPIGRSVTDVAALLNAVAGHCDMDSTSAPDDLSGLCDYAADLETPIEGLRIGVAREYVSDANDPEVRDAIERSIEAYRSMGAEIVDVSLPHTEYGIPTYYLVATAEASSNLARYDGVHYGYRTERPDDLVDLYAASRAEGFGDEVKRRIMLGTYALSTGYADQYYNRALKVRRLIKQDFDRAFESCDVILGPTATSPAFKIGENTDDPLKMYLNDVYTVNANLAGIPGVSLPCGYASVGGKNLPLGLQLLGPTFSEARLLRVARMFEKAVDWTAGLEPVLT